jgi:choline dehydrogenase-like flavoprotein
MLRYREADFAPRAVIVGDSGAAWPFGYDALEPYYGAVEQMLDVAGVAGEPGEPPRRHPYPQPPAPLSPVALRIAAAARALGLHPSRLPLAINHRAGPRQCTACGTCDSYACAEGAKNDPASMLLPDLIARGLELRPGTVALRLEARAGRVTGVTCLDTRRRCLVTIRARAYVMAAGALATPHLLLASGLDRVNPGGHVVGRYLMRHCNAVVFGVFPGRLDGYDAFHKQLYIPDYSEGRAGAGPEGPLGIIQQIHPPPSGLLREMLGPVIGGAACNLVPRMTGLVVITEDQPRADNRLTLDHRTRDGFGLPQATIYHRYTARDLAARQVLVDAAWAILRRAGAVLHYVHRIRTFTHAVGTVRMGIDPTTSALDEHGWFRGLGNLYVADASALPTSAGVNPALTIAAHALRVGQHLTTTLVRESRHGIHTGRSADPRIPRVRVGHPNA